MHHVGTRTRPDRRRVPPTVIQAPHRKHLGGNGEPTSRRTARAVLGAKHGPLPSGPRRPLSRSSPTANPAGVREALPRVQPPPCPSFLPAPPRRGHDQP